MSFNMRSKMLRQLELYRKYVSDNDVVLHYKYKKIVEALYGDIPCTNVAYMMYSHASLFRETMFIDIYNTLHTQMRHRWERGQHHAMQGRLGIQVHIYADEFSILYNFDGVDTHVTQKMRQNRKR